MSWSRPDTDNHHLVVPVASIHVLITTSHTCLTSVDFLHVSSQRQRALRLFIARGQERTVSESSPSLSTSSRVSVRNQCYRALTVMEHFANILSTLIARMIALVATSSISRLAKRPRTAHTVELVLIDQPTILLLMSSMS